MPDWISVLSVKDFQFQKELEKRIDLGEASAIALARELENSILIIDEKKGRKIAKEYQITIIGTLKVLILGKKKGFIPTIKDPLKKLHKIGFRFSRAILEEILREANEN